MMIGGAQVFCSERCWQGAAAWWDAHSTDVRSDPDLTPLYRRKWEWPGTPQLSGNGQVEMSCYPQFVVLRER